MNRMAFFLIGIYYSLFGLWGIINVRSFSLFTQHQGDYFLKQTNAVLFLGIGILFIWIAWQKMITIPLLMTAAIVTIGTALTELFYLPRMGNPLPFWLDFWIEVVFGIYFVYLLLRRKTSD